MKKRKAIFVSRAFMIISGGVNIYPQEVENALTMHPAVHDVAVIGIPDPEMGEQVKAVVQVAQGVEANDALAAELIAHVKAKIAHFKAPRSVDFVDSLPRSATGKMVKGTARAIHPGRLGRDPVVSGTAFLVDRTGDPSASPPTSIPSSSRPRETATTASSWRRPSTIPSSRWLWWPWRLSASPCSAGSSSPSRAPP